MARPAIELNERTQARIYEALRVGASLEHTAKYAGISDRTLRRWLKRGAAEAEGEFSQLWQQAEKARAELAIALLLKINNAANKHWKAAVWRLEQLYPHLYGKAALKNPNPDSIDDTSSDAELEELDQRNL